MNHRYYHLTPAPSPERRGEKGTLRHRQKFSSVFLVLVAQTFRRALRDLSVKMFIVHMSSHMFVE